MQQLEHSARLDSIPVGTMIAESGDAADSFYFIRKGQVEVYYYNSGTRISVAFLGEGQFFGEIGFFDGNPRTRNLQAAEDSELLVWDHASIDKLSHENPSLYGNLVTALYRKINNRFRRVLEDLDPLTGYGAQVTHRDRLTGISSPVPHEWLTSPEFIRIKFIAEQFKADIFSLSYRLQEAKAPFPELRDQCFAVLNSLYENVLDYGRSYPQAPEAMWGFLFKEIFPYFMRSRYAERIYFKPRGYAGDHQMMEMTYRNRPEGDGKLGELVDAWCLESVGARATRGRRKLLREWLLKEAGELSKRQDRLNIMNMACGPARELADFLGSCPFSRHLEILCVDIDEDALACADENLKEVGHEANVRFLKENLIKWSLGKANQWIDKQDIIYSAGLTDYLEDRLFIALVNRAHEQLNSGGRLIIGNFSPNPDQFFMDHILHWRLIYRTESQLRALFRQTRFGNQITIRSEVEGVNLFVEAVKQ